ncbi:hypothetical protein GQR58_028237 [Nymphon striatum]|nr:hypothetical protein GQR58_028237 [Nymphon striatum]
MTEENSNKRCIICLKDFITDKIKVQVGEKGIQSLIKFSRIRKHVNLKHQLKACTENNTIVSVHKNCHRDFTDIKRTFTFSPNESPGPNKRLRSSIELFNWKGNCFLWAKRAVQDTKNPKRKSIHQVSTLELSKRLIEQCHVRSDGWGEAVFTRLSCSNDLMLCIWLDVEAGAEFYTLQELHTEMSEIAHGEDVYSVKRLKQKLLKRYQDYIYFAEIGGRSNVVCFRRMVDYILNETWYEERNQNKEREAEKIILTAAKLIMAEIREIKYDSSVYPKDEEIHNQNEQWRLPNGLKTFLGVLVKSVLKQQSIGQSIVFAARPRSVIPPIMFGLGVHLDHVFGSKWLIEELSHLGFSVSYQEVTRFKQSAMATEDASQISTKFPPGTFTQYVADNVDHNLCTLDGKDTFHGMGIIQSSTNKSRLQRQSQTIKREFLKPVSQVTKDKEIPLVQYIDSNFCVMSKKIFTDLRQLQFNHEFTIESNIDLLWQTSYFFKQQNRPSWSGFMQTFRSGDYPGQSKINLLPIINLNPSDMTCSYSTLLFVIDQCKKNNSGPACITFDQPLWIKATEIASKKSLAILCRLGGFHMLMSFLGSVGTVMKGSGLSECLQTIYGENSVTHIMSGKAVSRALRSHFLLQSALCLNILNNVVLQENRATTQAVQSVERMYNLLVADEISDDEVTHSEVLKVLTDSLAKKMEEMATHSRTSKLWIQYIKYVDIIKMFVTAERTGKWQDHLVNLNGH